MSPRNRPSSVVLNGKSDGECDDREADRVTSADDALAAAEEADAEAAEAEAVAAAARARARAIRLRREAAASEAAKSKAVEPKSTATDVSSTAATKELDQPTELAESAATESDADDTDDPNESDRELTESSYDELDDELPPAPAAWRTVAKALVAAVLVAGTVALLGLSVAMYVHGRNVEAQRAQSAEFAAAARQGVVTLMSLNFNSAKDDVQRIIDNTTGDFKKDFQGQADDFIKVAQESKVITEANVQAVAVQSMSKDQATVLVAVTTNVSNKASAKQDPRSWRLRVGVARDGDQIKLAKVEFVP